MNHFMICSLRVGDRPLIVLLTDVLDIGRQSKSVRDDDECDGISVFPMVGAVI